MDFQKIRVPTVLKINFELFWIKSFGQKNLVFGNSVHYSNLWKTALDLKLISALTHKGLTFEPSRAKTRQITF